MNISRSTLAAIVICSLWTGYLTGRAIGYTRGVREMANAAIYMLHEIAKNYGDVRLFQKEGNDA